MTLLEELSCTIPSITSHSRRVELGDPIFKLPFDGRLSYDEMRMSDEETLPWVDWERE